MISTTFSDAFDEGMGESIAAVTCKRCGVLLIWDEADVCDPCGVDLLAEAARRDDLYGSGT